MVPANVQQIVLVKHNLFQPKQEITVALRRRKVNYIADSLAESCFTLEHAVRNSDGSKTYLLLRFHVVLADFLERHAARDSPATHHWLPF